MKLSGIITKAQELMTNPVVKAGVVTLGGGLLGTLCGALFVGSGLSFGEFLTQAIWWAVGILLVCSAIDMALREVRRRKTRRLRKQRGPVQRGPRRFGPSSAR